MAGDAIPDRPGPMPMTCECGSTGCSREFWDAFRIAACFVCRQNHALISKSKAKDQYLLTDSELDKLPSLARKNPMKKEWKPMKLLLLSQVESTCVLKYGSLEGLEDRRSEAIQRRVQRRDRIDSRSLNKRRGDAARAELQRKKKRQLEQKYEQGTEQCTHDFRDVEERREDGTLAVVKKCAACGVSCDVEEL